MSEQYADPIGPGLTGERVDMGVDYGGAGPLYAVGSGTIVNLYNNGWPGGGFIGLHLDSGQYVYYAENVQPTVKVGQKVTAGQQVGRATGGPNGVELGWAASPGTGETMAAQSGQNKAGLAQGDPGKFPTGYGVSFNNLINALGGPGGVVTGTVQGAVPDTTTSGCAPGSATLVAIYALFCTLQWRWYVPGSKRAYRKALRKAHKQGKRREANKNYGGSRT